MFSSEAHSKSFPQWQRLSVLLRTVADGCEHRNNGSRTRLYPQTPRVKREPFATHSGKNHWVFCQGHVKRAIFPVALGAVVVHILVLEIEVVVDGKRRPKDTRKSWFQNACLYHWMNDFERTRLHCKSAQLCFESAMGRQGFCNLKLGLSGHVFVCMPWRLTADQLNKCCLGLMVVLCTQFIVSCSFCSRTSMPSGSPQPTAAMPKDRCSE